MNTQIRTPESEGDPGAVNLNGRVRHTDRSTSQEAAARLTNGELTKRQQEAYEVLLDFARGDDEDDESARKFAGRTDDELRRYVSHASKSGPATRRGELERAGWVKPLVIDGQPVRRDSDAGQPMTVWVAVPEAEYTGPVETSRQAKAREQHEAGMRAARQRASWELGDASSAEAIVHAYLHPTEDGDELNREMGNLS